MRFKTRRIFIISILSICIIAINLAVYFQITKKPSENDTKDKIIIDSAMLIENFDQLFDNRINYQNYQVNVAKIEHSKEFVYTNYETNQEQGQIGNGINVSIPHFNINSPVAESINAQIDNLFYQKAMELSTNNHNQTVYNVKYKAFVNDNILSLIIHATLKEGENAQRVMIKTYNYNLSSHSELNIKEVLQYRNLATNTVQEKINETINAASEDAHRYQELGYHKYLRNVNDPIYQVENTKVYFLGENKALYIIYPYGNSNYTSEIDLLVI